MPQGTAMRPSLPRAEIREMLRLIRIDRFNEVLPVMMRRHGIGMFIYVMRLGRSSVPGAGRRRRSSHSAVRSAHAIMWLSMQSLRGGV